MTRSAGADPTPVHTSVPSSAISPKLQPVPMRDARPMAAPVVALMRIDGEIANVEAPKAPQSFVPDATIPAAVNAIRLAWLTPAPKDALPIFLAPLPSSV